MCLYGSFTFVAAGYIVEYRMIELVLGSITKILAEHKRRTSE